MTVVGFYSFASLRNQNRKLTKSVVKFVGFESQFITKESVNKLLIENNLDVKTIHKVDLDLNKLEKTINKNDILIFASVGAGMNVNCFIYRY